MKQWWKPFAPHQATLSNALNQSTFDFVKLLLDSILKATKAEAAEKKTRGDWLSSWKNKRMDLKPSAYKLHFKFAHFPLSHSLSPLLSLSLPITLSLSLSLSLSLFRRAKFLQTHNFFFIEFLSLFIVQFLARGSSSFPPSSSSSSSSPSSSASSSSSSSLLLSSSKGLNYESTFLFDRYKKYLGRKKSSEGLWPETQGWVLQKQQHSFPQILFFNILLKGLNISVASLSTMRKNNGYFYQQSNFETWRGRVRTRDPRAALLSDIVDRV